jgi:hypothetical protein
LKHRGRPPARGDGNSRGPLCDDIWNAVVREHCPEIADPPKCRAKSGKSVLPTMFWSPAEAAAQLEKSDRAIAAYIGIDHKTVSKARKESTGDYSPVDKRTGRGGRARKRPKRPKLRATNPAKTPRRLTQADRDRVAEANAIINGVAARTALLQTARAARELLRQELTAGPRLGSEVEALAEGAGIPSFALVAAAEVLGVVTRRGEWRLPDALST